MTRLFSTGGAAMTMLNYEKNLRVYHDPLAVSRRKCSHRGHSRGVERSEFCRVRFEAYIEMERGVPDLSSQHSIESLQIVVFAAQHTSSLTRLSSSSVETPRELFRVGPSDFMTSLEFFMTSKNSRRSAAILHGFRRS